MSIPKPNEPEMDSAEVGSEAGSQAMDAALRSSFVILKGVIALLVVFLIFSNTKTVEDQQEGAIVLRFGKSRTPASEVWDPGLRFAFPYPIEEVKELEAVSPVSTLFAWTEDKARDLTKTASADVDPNSIEKINAANPTQGYLVTKDQKILHLKATMNYQITDPDKFVFGFHEVTLGNRAVPGAERVLKAILESALTHAARQRTLEEIIGTQLIPADAANKASFQELVRARVIRLMKQYDLGVKLKGAVTLDTVGDNKQIPRSARISWAKYKNQQSQSTKIESDANLFAATNKVSESELKTIANNAETQRKVSIASLDVIATQFTNIVNNFPKPDARQRHMEELYLAAIKRIAQNPDVKIWLVPQGAPGQPTRIRLQINQPKAQDQNAPQSGEE